MNTDDLNFAYKVRHALNEQLDDLPASTTDRLAQARKLGAVAPYFIDADATPNPGGAPLGGLTVVSFRNAHLAYAATWFALAALCVAGLVLLRRNPGQVFAGR